MCDVCLKTPCHSRCPNANEPSVVHKCLKCGEWIVEGDDFYDVDGEPWCEDCMRKCRRIAEVEE